MSIGGGRGEVWGGGGGGQNASKNLSIPCFRRSQNLVYPPPTSPLPPPILNTPPPPKKKKLHNDCFNLSWDDCKSQDKLKTILMQKFSGLNDCFNLSWDDCKSQDKLKTILMQKLSGLNKVYFGIVKIVNSSGF